MIAQFLSIIVYAVICFVSLIGSVLYFYAYLNMKRTPIIGLLSLLLATICIDGFFWFGMEVYRFMNNQYYELLISPDVLVFIKSILAIGLILFVAISVKTQNKEI